jgi:hypothetical protein
MTNILPAQALGNDGHHCGAKPKRHKSIAFCRHCKRSFAATGEQIANHFYSYGEDGRFRPTQPESEPFKTLLHVEQSSGDTE